MNSNDDLGLSLHSLRSVDSNFSSHQHEFPQGLNDQNIQHHQNESKSKNATPNSNTPEIVPSISRRQSIVSTVLSLGRSKTAATTLSRKTQTVPIKNRRGLFAQVCLVPEYTNARDYSPKIKFLIVLIVAMAAITGPMGTSIMLPAIDDVARDLHTTNSVVNVSVGIYLLSLGIFPLWWSALSERLGRRSIYVVSFTLFCAFSIGSSLSPSIGALIAFRVLCGGCSALVQAVGAGTISDLYIQDERGRAMGFYYLGPLMGPFFAPIIGGVLSDVWDWRATQWFMVIMSGVNVLLIILGLPETLLIADELAQVNYPKDSEITDDPEKNFEGTNRLRKTTSNVSRRSYKSMLERDDEDGAAEAILDMITPVLSRRLTNEKTHRTDPRVQLDSNNIYSTEKSGVKSSKDDTSSASDEDDELRIEPIYNNYNNQSEIDNTSSRRVEKLETRSLAEEKIPFKTLMYDFFIRPMHSLYLLTYPPVWLVIVFSLVNFSCIYFFNLTISYEYSREPYNFSSIITGLMYIPNSVTYIIASLIGGRWIDNLLKEYKAKHGVARPEARISWNIVIAIALVFPAMLIFGWCIDKKTHWVVPLVGTAIFGFSLMLIIGAIVTYLVDTLPGKGATGVALNNFVRMILAAIATFVVDSALTSIGPGILFLILLGIQILMSWTIILLKWKGAYIREKYDLKDYYAKL